MSDIKRLIETIKKDLDVEDTEYYKKMMEILDIVEKEDNINATNKNKTTALMLASKKGYVNIVKILIENGADVDASTDNGITALMTASSKGYKDIVKLMIENGVNINASMDNGLTALMTASEGGHEEIVDFLVKRGMDINASMKNGQTAIMFASSLGHIDTIRFLVENGADVNASMDNGLTALMIASPRGYKEIVKLLIKNGADVDTSMENKITALILASEVGHTDIVKLLIENSANVNAPTDNGQTALAQASIKGHIDIVKLLIENGANVNASNKNGWTALIIASFQSYTDIAKLLIENSANVDALTEYGFTALMEASLEGHIDIVKLLIENGANVNAPTDNGFNALMIASERGHKEIVKLLIKNGANVNASMENKITALMLASEVGHTDIVKLLLENGADVNASMDNGQTALAQASIKGHIDIVKLLIENGINVNTPIENKITALILASEVGHTDIVKLLLENGANINASMYGSTALLKASSRGHIDIVKLLIEKGVDVNTSNNGKPVPPIILLAINKSRLIEKIKNKNLKIDEKIDILDSIEPLYKNQYEITKILLENGADINKKISNGLNAYIIAKSTKNKEIIELFRKNGVTKFKFSYKLIGILIKSALKNTKIFKYLKDYGVKNVYKPILEDFILSVFMHRTGLNSDLTEALKSNDSIKLKEWYKKEENKEKYISVGELIRENRPRDMIDVAVKYAKNIDLKSSDGKTALMIAVENKDIDLAKTLLTKGASLDTKDLNGEDVYDYAYNSENEEIIELLNQHKELRKINNYPKKLVRLLKNFTLDTPIKCTTHAWEASCESCKEMSFDDFMYKVQTQWDLIKKDIKELSPNLHNKIEAFIFSRSPKEWCKDTGLDIGWSNLDGLREHCDDGGKPFEFVLKKPINLKDETLTAFKEVIKRFKEKIEVRNDSDMLKSIFVDFEEKLNNNEITCDICPSIDGIDFYTDVEKFKSTLNLILNGIVAKKNNRDKVEIKLTKPNPESVEIHIIHKNSFSNRTKEEMLAQADDGDFKGIKENLTNLCDWSVEDVFEDKSYRVNYLKSNNTKDTQELNEKTIGFTHILRFYQ